MVDASSDYVSKIITAREFWRYFSSGGMFYNYISQQEQVSGWNGVSVEIRQYIACQLNS